MKAYESQEQRPTFFAVLSEHRAGSTGLALCSLLAKYAAELYVTVDILEGDLSGTRHIRTVNLAVTVIQIEPMRVDHSCGFLV